MKDRYRARLRNTSASALFGLALVQAVAIPPAAAQEAVLQQSPQTPVSNDGSEFVASASGVQAEDGFAGSGTGDALAEFMAGTESSAEAVWRLWNLIPHTAGRGIESIIGADNRVLVNPTTTFPARATVLITFRQGTGSFRCTGWLYGKDIVATAGHCVHSGGTGGVWSTNVIVYPGRNGNSSPYGSCSARRLHSVTGWTTSKNEQYDYGAIKLNCTIGNTTGWYGYFWQSASLTGTRSIINGYPGDKPLTQWKSTDQIRVTQTRQLFYQNDTVGGMSGAPVYNNFPAGSLCVGNCAMAVHAYGLHGAAPHSTNNHGTRIVEAVFNNLKAWKDAP